MSSSDNIGADLAAFVLIAFIVVIAIWGILLVVLGKP